MTKKEHVASNIGVTFDFVRHIIDHPELVNALPDGTELDFIDKEMPIKSKEHTNKRRVTRYKVQHTFELVNA